MIAASAAGADVAVLKIGAGASVITPFLDEQMAGYYYDRSADGLHDDLHAKTLVFDDGQTRVALVACDLVNMPRAAVKDARERIQKRFGIPGELFVEFGLQIQKASPFPHTIIVELANDSIGYIPTRAAFEEGGYEPNSTRMAPGGGELIVAKALELLKQLHR